MSATAKKLETLEGVVTSAKSAKTVTVTVAELVKHQLYHKYLKHDRVYRVHDEKGEAKEGDRVEIRACRPISKTKHWRLIRVVERAPVV